MLNSSSQDIIAALCQSLAAGDKVYLATVLSTWGSSPRPPGAMMVWSQQRGVVGSVSGGCVEDDLLARLAAGEFDHTLPCEIPYGGDTENVSAYTAKPIQLPCGGLLRVLLEHIPHSDLLHWQAIGHLLAERQGISRDINRATGQWHYAPASPHVLQQHDSQFKVYLGPTRKLFIVGANQIAHYLANFASALDFSVTICDPSEHLGEQWQRGEFEFISRYPDGIIEQRFFDANSAVVAISHDPRLDDMAIMEALPTQAFYVGVMGSKRTTDKRLERLKQLDIPTEQLAQLKAPVGLDIGSKAPAEIAISIAAHLVESYAKS